MSLPSTIYNQDAFMRSPSAGNDGVFDWSWSHGCFGETRITPMDFDGVIERRGNFLLFETKNPGNAIPIGQEITLKSAHALGCFTVMVIHGKQLPEEIEVWYPNSQIKRQFQGVDAAKEQVKKWFAYANKNPRQKVDVTLLNLRITSLIDEKVQIQSRVDQARGLLAQAMILLTGDVS